MIGVENRWLYAGGMLALLLALVAGVMTGGTPPSARAQDSTATVELETDDDSNATEEATGETQETPEATGDAGTEADRSLVAAIFPGTCVEFSDDPLFDVGDLPAAEQLAAEEETEFVGSTEAASVFRVEVILGSAIETLFTEDEPYVLVVRDSEQDKRYLACGELGGYPVDGQIVVGLRADDGDDGDDRDEFCGIAVFGASEDQGDDLAEDQTPLRIYLFATAEDDGDVDGNQNVDATADVTAEADATADVTAESTAESDDDSGGDDDNSGSGGGDDDSGGDDDNSGSGGGDDSDDDD